MEPAPFDVGWILSLVYFLDPRCDLVYLLVCAFVYLLHRLSTCCTVSFVYSLSIGLDHDCRQHRHGLDSLCIPYMGRLNPWFLHPVSPL